MSAVRKTIQILILSWLPCIFFTACGLQKSGTILGIKEGNDRSVNGAVNAIKTLGNSAGCQGCHSGTGQIAWMAADQAEATSLIYRLTNLTEPANSRFLEKATDGHYGANATELSESSWMEAISAFATAFLTENPDAGTPPDTTTANWVATASVNLLPATGAFPTYPQFTAISIPLGSIRADLNGAFLDVRVSTEPTVPNVLALWNIRIRHAFANNALIVRGMVFQLNEIDHPYEGRGLKTRTAIVLAPGALFSPDKILMTKLGVAMRVRVLMESITRAPNYACKNLTGFVNNILPILTTANRLRNLNGAVVGTTCRQCHGAGNSNVFDLRTLNSNDVLCTTVLSRADTQNPTLSPMLTRIRTTPHPTLLQLSPADLALFTNWAISER